VLAVALVAALGGCVRNPATGKQQLSLVSEQEEIALGKQAAEQIAQTMPRYEDPKVQAYVEGIGKRMAAASERPALPWTFTVLDDPTVNAFALPGGPVYVTRGILTHLNSEAELAAVMGHEIGHITAMHSVQQISKASLAQLGLGVGAILKPELAGVAQAAGAGLQLLFLKFGRDAESEADQLGFRYMLGQQYDPREMAPVFHTLGRASAQAGGGRLPEWLSTHPNPENREVVAQERAAKMPAPSTPLKVERDRYLALVAGMVFGDNPRQGFFRGNAFLHPDLKFQITFPEGWKKQNAASAVVAVSPGDDAAIQLKVVGPLPPAEAAKQFFAQQGVRAASVQPGTLHAMPAAASYFEAQTQQGVLRGLVSFVSYGGATYQLLGLTEASALPKHDPAFKSAIGSFGALTDAAALSVQPARVELVKVPRAMTLAEFASQFPSTVPVEVIGIVNGVDDKAGFKAGQTAKRVVGGVPATAPAPGAKPAS
jgi:predicted Zn-dependent protease